MKKYIVLALLMSNLQWVYAQSRNLPSEKNSSSNQLQARIWTEPDKQYLLENFRRTRDALIEETVNLSNKQWHFKETPERWSIAEIMEHLALWEVIFARETNIALRSNPQLAPEKFARPDSFYLNFIMEEKQHQAPDYARSTGFIQGKNNLAFFLTLRDQVIRFLETTQADLKAYYEPVGNGVYRNVHQIYLVQWGHVDRHLRQIKKVKAHPAYPKR